MLNTATLQSTTEPYGKPAPRPQTSRFLLDKSICVPLFRELAAPLLLAGAVNAVIYLAGWNFNNQVSARLWYAPPGYMIGVIWMVLFALMGYAKHLVCSTDHPDSGGTAHATEFFIVGCALFPAYTSGFRSMPLSFCGALLTVVWGLYLYVRLFPVNQRASALFTPVLVWSIYATFLTVRTIMSVGSV